MFKATDVQMCVSRLMMPAVPWSAEPRTFTHNRNNLQQETEGCFGEPYLFKTHSVK
jgi:hypothetical protein